MTSNFSASVKLAGSDRKNIVQAQFIKHFNQISLPDMIGEGSLNGSTSGISK
jgi:hypothetical protein